MLRSIVLAVARALVAIARTACEIALFPLRAVMQALFPALTEPVSAGPSWEVNRDLLPVDDTFVSAEEAVHAKELETNAVLTWAADRAYSAAEVPIPDHIRPMVGDWLRSLSDQEVETLINAGKQALYTHLHFSMPIPGLPNIEGRGRRPRSNDPGLTCGLPWTAAPARAV
jgi:hypothetical protein